MNRETEMKNARTALAQAQHRAFCADVDYIRESYSELDEKQKRIIASRIEFIANDIVNQNLSEQKFDGAHAKRIRQEAGFSTYRSIADALKIAGSRVCDYESGKSILRFPPKKGSPNERYLLWLKEQGYNPFRIGDAK